VVEMQRSFFFFFFWFFLVFCFLFCVGVVFGLGVWGIFPVFFFGGGGGGGGGGGFFFFFFSVLCSALVDSWWESWLWLWRMRELPSWLSWWCGAMREVHGRKSVAAGVGVCMWLNMVAFHSGLEAMLLWWCVEEEKWWGLWMLCAWGYMWGWGAHGW